MEKPVGVAQVVHSLEIGGMERVALHLATHLNRQKYHPLIVCLTVAGDFGVLAKQAGVEVIAMGKQPGVDLKLPFKLAKVFQEKGVRIIHAHNSGPWFSGGLASLVGGKAKVVVTDHSRSYPERIRVRLIEWALHHKAKIVSVSQDNKRQMAENLWIPEEKIHVIHNGVAPVAMPSNEKRESLMKEMGVDEDHFVFLFVARFEKQKGMPYLIEAAAKLKDKYPRMRIILLGKGSFESQLPDLLKKNGLEKQIIVAGFRLDVTDFFSIGDCLLVSSLWEGLPMSILEAISAGLPVVSTNVGDVSSAVSDSENGFLVKPQDADALAGAMENIMRQKTSEMENFQAASRRIFNERFHVDVMVRQYERLYEDML